MDIKTKCHICIKIIYSIFCSDFAIAEAAKNGRSFLDPGHVEVCFRNAVFDVYGNKKTKPSQVVIPDRSG